MSKNDHELVLELNWINNLIKSQIEHYFSGSEVLVPEIMPPVLEEGSHYERFVKEYSLSLEDRKIVGLALVAELRSHYYDILLTKNKLYDAPFTEFGGIVNQSHLGFRPTIQTALFLLAAGDLQQELEYRLKFDRGSELFTRHILDCRPLNPSDSHLQAPLRLDEGILHKILYGKDIAYEYSPDFPAKELKTLYSWSDLILPPYTASQLSELEMWLKHEDTLINDWGMAKGLSPGYRALFYGSPGTGKTLAASVLGNHIGRKVYRIDLSQIISKYIGETEKNLSRVFEMAKQKDWILFFDEADSLFGKRTRIGSSNDRFANQETSYLLQRIEECENVVILASNLKENLDEAFTRRFNSIIYFPLPTEKERLKLWENGFSKQSSLCDKVDLYDISQKYELSGASIMNAIRYCSLLAVNRGESVIVNEDIMAGIFREQHKEGKIV